VIAAAILIAVCVAGFACGRYLDTLPGALAVIAILLALSLGGDDTVPFMLATLGPWLAGFVVRSRQALVDSLRRRTDELEHERAELARLAAEAERARIARELHDIIAHHLAVIVVQAGAGRISAGERSENAARLARIAEAGEQALAEMDHLVDLLGEHEAGTALDVQALLDQARAAGLRVDARLSPLDLPRTLEPIVHAILREGITNTIKHAPGAHVDLLLATRTGELEIELLSSAGEGEPTLRSTGSALGLVGLRERVEAFGGRFESGAANGGWRLRAELPLR
jgi:signal transduction histidine kinase